MVSHIHPPPFRIVDCALVNRIAGRSVQNLRELRDALLTADTTSVYNHFWGGLLRPRFDDPEFHNDFAIWARRGLHDRVLAERFAVIDPSDFADLEELRGELVDICEDRLAEVDMVPWSRADGQFHFQSAHIVVWATGREVARPRDLAGAVPRFSRGSIFYHFIDARRRNEDHRDDLSRWLSGCGSAWAAVIERLAAIDPFQGSLHELKRRVVDGVDGVADGGCR